MKQPANYKNKHKMSVIDYQQQLDEILAIRSVSVDECSKRIEDLIDEISLKQKENVEDYANIFEKVLTSLLSLYTQIGDENKFSFFLPIDLFTII